MSSNRYDNYNHKQKRRVVVKPKSSSSESSSSESSSSESSSSESSYSEISCLNKKNTPKEYLSSSTDSEPHFKTKKLKTRNRIAINVVLLSSSSDEEEEEIVDRNSDKDNDKEDDDDIQFLELIPANRSTICRYDFGSKINDSSNTESSFSDFSDSDMDINDSIQQLTTICPQSQSLTTDSSNCVDVCEETAIPTKTPTDRPQPTIIWTNGLQSEGLTTGSSNCVNVCEETVIPIKTPTDKPHPTIIWTNSDQLEGLTTGSSNGVNVCDETAIHIKTPTDKPHATTVWKNGQALVVPPPPQLDAFILIKVITPTQTINGIKKRLNTDSDEIEAIDQTLKISLICPITNKRVVTPCRSCFCHHFDCFDINSFLGINYNKKIENWKCPKCKQSAQKDELIVDSLLQRILSHPLVADPTVESVIFDKKGFWRPDIKPPEIYVNKNSDNKDVIHISDSNADEIIELDDDDDDETTPTPTLLAPLSMPKFSETIAAAKSFASNVSNLIQSNQKNVNKTGTSNANEVLPFNILDALIPPTTTQSNTRTNTRWSGPTVNVNTIQQRNVALPTNPPNFTIRIANGVSQIIAQNIRQNNGQQTNKQINRQQSGQQISAQNIRQNIGQNNQQTNRQQIVPQNSGGQQVMGQNNQQSNRQQIVPQNSGQVMGQNNQQNNGQRSNQQNNRQQNVPQNSFQQNQIQAQQKGPFIALSMPNTTTRVTPNPTNNPNPPSTANTSNSGSEFKFNYVNNSMEVHCYSCDKTFDANLLEQHKKSAIHMRNSNPSANRNTLNVSNSNQSSTTNRSTAQSHRVPPVRAHTTTTNNNNNYRNTVPNYNSNTNNYRYPQQRYTNPSATYTTQLIQPYITNNYYPQTAQYMPQMAPPAHQTQVNSVYTAPIYPTPHPYPGPPNQANTYYPNY